MKVLGFGLAIEDVELGRGNPKTQYHLDCHSAAPKFTAYSGLSRLGKC